MIACAIDHVVISSPDPDGLLARVSEATGLPILRGWTPGGEVESRGVRFANGPFLDVMGETYPPPVLLGLAGPVGETEAEAVRRGWRVKVLLEQRPPPPLEPPPWSVLAFRKGQGALSALFVVDYKADHPSWRTEEYSGELMKAEAARPGTARLTRVWIAANPSADDELAALGFRPGAASEGLRVFAGKAVEVVLCEPVGEQATVVRLDVEGGVAPAELRLAPNLLFAVS